MKIKTSLTAATLLFCMSLVMSASRAQQPSSTPRQTPAPQVSPTPPQQQTPAESDDVVRITTNLVQVDAVVVDKNGRQVTDLAAEDFEILEDGKSQQITNFSYVSNVTAEASPVAPAERNRNAEKGAPLVPPARLRSADVRRTIALVVDDIGASFESVYYIRRALKKYVDEQMQPGDLVAIMRTSAGMGSLQQFTNDKQLLYRAIEKVRWYPSGRAGISAFAPIEADPLAQAGEIGEATAQSNENRAGERERAAAGQGLDEFRDEIFSVGTLGALNFIVRGLRELPGRKSVVLFSDGFELFNREGQNHRILENLRRLTDLANRSSVVIYTIDARGLVTLGLTAADSTSGMTSAQIEQSLTERREKLFNTQDGLNYLAQQTGGFFVRNSNDLAGGVRRVLEDQRGFYLIGYRPDAETFDPARGRGRFNKIEVKVKRAGLRVRTRAGFYGFTEEEQPVRRTRADQLMAAITSPFGAGGVPLKQTSLFGNEGLKQSFINSITHIDVSNFKFTEEADGWRKTVIDVIALTFGENGQVIDSVNRTETIRVRGTTYEELLKSGLIYTMKVPVKKPGAYQLRIAVRDAGSERVGSASQYIEVPDIGRNRLALSGIVLTGNGLFREGDATAAQSSEQAPNYDPMATPAVRRFRQGSKVEYLLHVYNAKTGAATGGRAQLQYQLRIFREGRAIYTGALQSFDPGNQTDMKRLMVAGRLRLGTVLTPGDYVLQIVFYDRLAKEKQQMASQWIDFEIVK